MAVTTDTETWAGVMGQCVASLGSGRSQNCSAKVPCPLAPFTCSAGGQILSGPWLWFWYHQVTTWYLVPLQRLPVDVLLSLKPRGGCGMVVPAPAAPPCICARMVFMTPVARTNQHAVRVVNGHAPHCHVEVIQPIQQGTGKTKAFLLYFEEKSLYFLSFSAAEKSCGDPPTLPHAGQVWNGTSTPGSTVSYYCNQGFHASGEHNQSLCTVRGLWTDVSFSCRGTRVPAHLSVLPRPYVQPT